MAMNAQPQWYIDAWYPADGVAFVSRRPLRSDIWSGPGAPGVPPGGTTFLLQAPVFDLVPVERAIAFGAVHRGAQEGFSLGEQQEFGFESEAEIREFIRRIYAGSGPGTTGARPVEPEPEPGSPAGAPDPGVWNEIWPGFEAHDQQPEAPLEAATLKEAMHAAASLASTRAYATGLLFESAFATYAGGASQAASAAHYLMHAAYLLAPDEMQFFNRIDEERLLPAFSADTKVSARDLLHRYGRSRRSLHSVAELRTWQLPRAWNRMLQLPPRVHSWLDAMTFLTAERGYVDQSRMAAWLPLALALAAPMASWRDGGAYRGDDSDALIEASVELAASWIPERRLPAALEANIRAWCWRA